MSIPGYDYDPPTENSLIAALIASVGPVAAKALADLAAKQVGKRGPASLEDLLRMTEYLIEVSDMVRVTARSERIRAVTYRALHAAVK